MTKKVLKMTGKTLLGLAGLVAVYALAAVGLSRITLEREADTREEVAIYILTNGVHTDIVVPARSEQMDWTQKIRYAHTVAADSTYEYLAMGWGDKGFYLETPTWADLKASTAFNAAFGLSTTAIHTTYYRRLPENEHCKKIMISKPQFARLTSYLTNSFQQDADGQVMPIATNAQYGKTDAFYEAKGRYSMLHTCNTWANNGLKHSGLRCCLWTPFDTGIFLQYE